MLIKINGAIKKAGLFLIACSTMVCVCVVTTFSMFDDPPCKKRIMSQLFGHHNLNAICMRYLIAGLTAKQNDSSLYQLMIKLIAIMVCCY